MRVARVTYHGDQIARQTGSPQVEVERANHGELRGGPTDWNLAYHIQQIARTAWSNSGWLKAIAVREETTADELARRVFDEKSHDKSIAQRDRIKATEHLGRRVVYWLGTRVLEAEHQTTDLRERFGFVKVGQDGASESALLRAGQRAARRGIYACIHDLNVVPSAQGRGLGTAMAYVGLADQPGRMKSSAYVAANNRPMRAWAEGYGYRPTDEYEEDELISGVTVPMVRYQAPSVGAVLEKMEQRHPWLANGDRQSMFSLMSDEAEADAISRNPLGG